MSDAGGSSRAVTPEDKGSPQDTPVDDVNENSDVDQAEENDDRDDPDSELSEVDEAEFADFDPNTVALGPVEIDEEVARTLKAGKRKRPDKDGEGAPKKPKEGKREKSKKRKERLERTQTGAEEYDSGADGEILEGRRTAKPKSVRIEGERKERDRAKERKREEERVQAIDQENMTPEQRRAAALDAAMDAALKNPNKRRRKKDEVDLEEAFDDEIAALKIRMEQACQADNTARERSQPAVHKLKMLPEVVALLNRNTVRHSIVDPDTNFLLSVKFFLEPLNDGSLPAYNIQRDLFNALAQLPIEKEALLSSGIGKVVLYYTKSKRPEIGIKRIAERLLGEWSRPILKRSDDYKKRKIATKEYDFQAAQLALRPSGTQTSSQPSLGLSRKELDRERVLAAPRPGNRARLETHSASYTVAPKSTFDPQRAVDPASRPIGASGMEAFRKMTAKKGTKRG
ncbi:hypothetical protein V495_04706 [Pseudogymnoascus sp. VKM F-4514 (FW-929)]|nr:hypothetical protein V495_04706 [Pseudogymnoascus sp. VKM F-4514 (FW-929)]KFY53810.1 hypothetical protein V497_08207 [Pseudogymnoascus sp. VKM F-4516 (FW-969)]